MRAMIPTKLENPKGLHGRYYIQKVSGYKAYFPAHPNESEYSKRGVHLKDVFDLNDVPEGEKLIPQFVDVDDDAEYFVMRLDEGGSDIEHIKACRIGVHAYADAIEHHLPDLAKDLRERYPLI